MEPKNADEAARQLVQFGVGAEACVAKIRLLFPDADAERSVQAAIRWKKDRENASEAQ